MEILSILHHCLSNFFTSSKLYKALLFIIGYWNICISYIFRELFRYLEINIDYLVIDITIILAFYNIYIPMFRIFIINNIILVFIPEYICNFWKFWVFSIIVETTFALPLTSIKLFYLSLAIEIYVFQIFLEENYLSSWKLRCIIKI